MHLFGRWTDVTHDPYYITNRTFSRTWVKNLTKRPIWAPTLSSYSSGSTGKPLLTPHKDTFSPITLSTPELNIITIMDANTTAPDATTSPSRLTYYDIAFQQPREQNTAAPNPWKGRYALNFKAAPYTTQWVQMPDITKTRQGLGIPACRKFADGTDFHTLPVLKDNETGAVIGDSLDIANYLQNTFPDSGAGDLFPKQDLNFVCPGAVEILVPLSKRENVEIHPDYSLFNTNVDWAFTLHCQLTTEGMLWDPEVKEQIRAEFVRRAGVKQFEDMCIVGKEARQKMLDLLEKTLHDLAVMYQRDTAGPFLLGKTPSFADAIVGGWLRMYERCLEEGEWDQVAGWYGGVFGKLHVALQRSFGAVH
ncbi:hypothetical protein QBC43DRAFT_324261 [Cladorrhinum sp. PSN259]|nr:hypothetical protein QBC43DRAFT_324261 [Cladorrhinum sp. PSN259]